MAMAGLACGSLVVQVGLHRRRAPFQLFHRKGNAEVGFGCLVHTRVAASGSSIKVICNKVGDYSKGSCTELNLAQSLNVCKESVYLRNQFDEAESSGPLTALVAASLLLFSTIAMPLSSWGVESGPFQTYFGTAASASSYGGYGGNTNKRDSAEYVYDVPLGWKERLISKIEKGTNGTDSEFYNPKHKEEKVYVTYLAGFRRLAPRDNVLSNLALSDPNLQDLISYADDIKAADREGSGGQLYYDYEIDSPVAHGLISVTCTKNKLYAHFIKAAPQDWVRDESMLRHVHDSFQTVGKDPLAPPGEF